MKSSENLFIATTDTVTGLGCFDKKDLGLLYQLKKRPDHKKIIILVGSIQQARSFKQWNSEAEKMAKQYWPGAFTLIVDDQGFRMPNCKGLLELLNKRGPAYVTSANISGEPILSFEEAIEKFPSIKNKYNFGIGSNEPSKIIEVITKKELR